MWQFEYHPDEGSIVALQEHAFFVADGLEKCLCHDGHGGAATPIGQSVKMDFDLGCCCTQSTWSWVA